MNDASRFCPLCDVTLDLHDGPDSCGAADAKARLLEEFERTFLPGAVAAAGGGRNTEEGL